MVYYDIDVTLGWTAALWVWRTQTLPEPGRRLNAVV